MIIGITGTLGAGKGTIVNYLVKKKGFKHFSARAFITEEIKRRKLPVNRDSMVEVANDLRAKHSPAYVAESLFKKADKAGGDCVIESLRTEGEVNALKAKGKFYLFAVDAEPRIRYERVTKRKSSTDSISFGEFLKNEEREMTSKDPNKQNLQKCIMLADFRFDNSGSFEELYNQVEEVLKQIGDI